MCSWVKWVNAYKCLLHAFQLPASLPKQNSLCHSPRCESTSNGIANCHWDQVLHQNVTPTQRCTFEKSWFVRIAWQISRAALSQQKSLSICSGSKSYAVLFEKWLAWEQSGWEDEHVRHWVLEADGNEHGDREPNSNHLAGEVLIHQLDLAFQLLTDVTMALPLHGCNWTILNSSNSPTYDVCPSPWCTTTRPCKTSQLHMIPFTSPRFSSHNQPFQTMWRAGSSICIPYVPWSNAQSPTKLKGDRSPTKFSRLAKRCCSATGMAFWSGSIRLCRLLWPTFFCTSVATTGCCSSCDGLTKSRRALLHHGVNRHLLQTKTMWLAHHRRLHGVNILWHANLWGGQIANS